MPAHVVLSDITKSYGSHTVIAETSIAVAEGQFVSILGPSGCGKSTMLSMIAGLDFPTTGTVSAGGRPVLGPGPDRGMVFQDHALLPWLTARGNIEFGLKSARPELDRAERTRVADRYLGQVGLAHAAHLRPSRLGIARAFAIDPEILLLDEPFGALDALTRRELQLQLLDIWEASRRTVLMVTHDVDEAILLSDRVLVMGHGPSATVIADIAVDAPRPRHGDGFDDTFDKQVAGLRHKLIELLGNN